MSVIVSCDELMANCMFCLCCDVKNVSTLTILVMGKGGVGKSSTVNSIVGERVANVSAFQVSLLPGPVSVCASF